MKVSQLIIASIILFGFSNVTFATNKVTNCVSQHGDYSNNAYNINTTACNKTAQWQRLGKTWNADTQARTETNTSTDDGVSWTTKIDDKWVKNGKLTQGNPVKFIFDVTRSIVGNHKYDELKSWVDWNQDGKFSENETIIAKKWWKNKDSEGVVQTWNNLDQSKVIRNWYDKKGQDGTVNWDLYHNVNGGYTNSFNSQDTTATFTSSIFTIPTAFTELWLRARVVCENSLEHYSNGMNLLSYGYQDQGEVEDYKLEVAKAVVPVPEPSSLFALAIALLALCRRKNTTH